VNVLPTGTVSLPHASKTTVAVTPDAEAQGLVARAARGDPQAFEQLVSRYHGEVIRWAFVAIGDRDDAEDLAQAVWLRAYQSLGDFRGASRFSTWLYRITWNLGHEMRQKQSRRGSALAQWAESDGAELNNAASDDGADAETLSNAISQCVQQLPPRQRAVLTLIDFEGRSAADVAGMLDIAEGTVRTNLFKARRAIRQRLLEQEPQLIEELRP
jgi:RNA polymerase sigma-70 factor (ECF subfamily)